MALSLLVPHDRRGSCRGYVRPHQLGPGQFHPALFHKPGCTLHPRQGEREVIGIVEDTLTSLIELLKYWVPVDPHWGCVLARHQSLGDCCRSWVTP